MTFCCSWTTKCYLSSGKKVSFHKKSVDKWSSLTQMNLVEHAKTKPEITSVLARMIDWQGAFPCQCPTLGVK